MWADTLLRAEQLHLLRIVAWGALAILVGTALLVLGYAARGRSALFRWLGGTLAALGAFEALVAVALRLTVGMLDGAGAARLERVAWLELGLFIGLVAVGGALAAVGWRLARSRAAVAAGLACAIHGAALALLTLLFIPTFTTAPAAPAPAEMNHDGGSHP